MSEKHKGYLGNEHTVSVIRRSHYFFFFLKKVWISQSVTHFGQENNSVVGNKQLGPTLQHISFLNVSALNGLIKLTL